MKASALKYGILSTVIFLSVLIIILVPFHAFLTVWGASHFGHYITLRLWDEALLLVCGLGALYLVIFDRKVRTQTLTRKLTWLILVYCLVQLIWGLVAYKHHSVTAKALGYGLVVNIRFLLFFIVAWVIAVRSKRLEGQWPRLLLWPAVVVVIFGLLQILVLPTDFLRHFGYSDQTIAPYETINHNSHYIRIASTLRGANPLGAYLIIPITALAVLLRRARISWRTVLGLIAALIVLFFSFSRSSWIGALLSVGIVIAARVLDSSQRTAYLRLLGIAGGILVILLASIAFVFRHNARFENIAFHTEKHSIIKTTSDQGHAAALRTGMHDIAQQPLGSGTGTAGPASVYNNNKTRIAEDYYLQIGQETGVIGLLLFLAINAIVGYLLWVRRDDPLALALFASLIGISLVNLLSHAWTDDTLSYIWWGLAGMAIARMPGESTSQ